jgi:hypothetical protein
MVVWLNHEKDEKNELRHESACGGQDSGRAETRDRQFIKVQMVSQTWLILLS